MSDLTYMNEDGEHRRRARATNVALAIEELVQKFKDDPDRGSIAPATLRRYIKRRLDDQGATYPVLDEGGDLKAFGDSWGKGGLRLSVKNTANGKAILLSKGNVTKASRYLDDPDAYDLGDQITDEDLGLSAEPTPELEVADVG